QLQALVIFINRSCPLIFDMHGAVPTPDSQQFSRVTRRRHSNTAVSSNNQLIDSKLRQLIARFLQRWERLHARSMVEFVCNTLSNEPEVLAAVQQATADLLQLTPGPDDNFRREALKRQLHAIVACVPDWLHEMLSERICLSAEMQTTDGQSDRTSLSLTPNALLTARYYTTHTKKQFPAAAATDGQPDDQAMPSAELSGFCKRYPFSQVIYSNVLTQPDNSTSTGIVKAGKSSSRQPSFVLKRRVARERSSVSGPLDRAMSSDNSSEQVVRKAITQLRDAMHLPPK
ncbi:hypothetical protein BOX15_Mlig017442g1, partial [Macrostomum lignano]